MKYGSGSGRHCVGDLKIGGLPRGDLARWWLHLGYETRGEIWKLAGREICRDVTAAFRRHGLIDGAIRPQPSAPFAYVTTKTFLEAFGFAYMRDMPDIEPFKTERSMPTGQGEPELDRRLGLGDGEDQQTLEGSDAL